MVYSFFVTLEGKVINTITIYPYNSERRREWISEGIDVNRAYYTKTPISVQDGKKGYMAHRIVSQEF
jgi:hypothetical protein